MLTTLEMISQDEQQVIQSFFVSLCPPQLFALWKADLYDDRGREIEAASLKGGTENYTELEYILRRRGPELRKPFSALITFIYDRLYQISPNTILV